MPNQAGVPWNEWLLLGVQILTLVVIGVYVWKTWEMAAATRKAAEAAEETLKEAREGRIEEMAPAMLVYFDSTYWGGADIVMENAGRGAAADVSLTFDPPLQTTQPHELDRFFDATQSLIPPGYRIVQTFDTWPTLLESDLPRRYIVTVRYRGVQTGRSYEYKHNLDAEALRYRLIGSKKGVNEIAEELEKWREDTKRQRVRREQIEYTRLFKGPIEGPPPESGLQAVQFMLGYWQLQRELRASPETSPPTLPIISSVRSSILNVFRFLPTSEFTEDQKYSLTQVGIVAFSKEAELIGGTKQWMDKMEERMAAVERAFARSG